MKKSEGRKLRRRLVHENKIQEGKRKQKREIYKQKHPWVFKSKGA